MSTQLSKKHISVHVEQNTQYGFTNKQNIKCPACATVVLGAIGL